MPGPSGQANPCRGERPGGREALRIGSRDLYGPGYGDVLFAGRLFFHRGHGAQPEKPLRAGDRVSGAAEFHRHRAPGALHAAGPPRPGSGPSLSHPPGVFRRHLGVHRGGQRGGGQRRGHDRPPAALGSGCRRHAVPVWGKGDLVLPGVHVRGKLSQRPGGGPGGGGWASFCRSSTSC